MPPASGTAYVDGLKQTRGDFVILMDADFSPHVRITPAFAAPANVRIIAQDIIIWTL